MTQIRWQESVVLVTGGTGSFGKECVKILLAEYHPKKVIVFSRDELKQFEMRSAGLDHPSLRYFIGDIRDRHRLHRAMTDVDIVIHAAAMKQVPACEYNPGEAVLTNVSSGAEHPRRGDRLRRTQGAGPEHRQGRQSGEPLRRHEALRREAVDPGQLLRRQQDTRLVAPATGTCWAAAGASFPCSGSSAPGGRVTVTDARMTRFWLTLEQGVRFVLGCIEEMHGGEVFVPRFPA